MDRIPAYILAGGQSRRFGSDKARALIEGQPLVCATANVVRTAGHAVTVIADRPAKYADLGLNTIADITPGLGPLGGLYTLWHYEARSEWTIVIACDMAPLDPSWLQLLVNARHSHNDVVLFDTEPRHPLLGCYRRTTAKLARHLLGTPRPSMKALVENCDLKAISAPESLKALHNINRRKDLVTAARCIREIRA